MAVLLSVNKKAFDIFEDDIDFNAVVDLGLDAYVEHFIAEEDRDE